MDDELTDDQKAAEKAAKKRERELKAALFAALMFLPSRTNLYAVLMFGQDVWPQFNDKIGGAIAPVFDAFDEAGRALWPAFDSLDPATVQAQRDYKAAFVREFGAGTKAAVDAVFAWGRSNNVSSENVARILAFTAGTNQRQTGAMLAQWLMLQQTGASPGILDAMMRKLADKYLSDRAKTTAGTELWRAINMGREAAAGQAERMSNEPVVATKRWVTAADEFVCPRCSALHGQEAPIGEVFPGGSMMPPEHPSCFPGDTLVTAAGISAASERVYSGPVAIIETAGGHKLTATINHPILTTNGWIAIGELNEESRVICCALGQSLTAAGVNNQHMPTSIKEISKAFGCTSGVAPRKVPISAPHFHGDGVGCDIANIWTNRQLFLNKNPPIFYPLGECGFGTSNMGGVHHFCGGGSDTAPMINALPSSQYSGMGSGDLCLSLFGRHLPPLHSLGITLPPDGNPKIRKSTRDHRARNSKLFREIIDGSSGKVFADRVISVRKKNWRGHVYNLQVSGEVYIAGGILVHNCRCHTEITITPR